MRGNQHVCAIADLTAVPFSSRFQIYVQEDDDVRSASGVDAIGHVIYRGDCN